jgi:hypothetical protein
VGEPEFGVEDVLSLVAVAIAVFALYLSNLRRAEIVLFIVDLPPSRQPRLTGGYGVREWSARIEFSAYNNGAQGGILDPRIEIHIEGPPGVVDHYDLSGQLVPGPGVASNLQALEGGDMIVLIVDFNVSFGSAGDDRDSIRDFLKLMPEGAEFVTTITYHYITQPLIPVGKKQAVKIRKVNCAIPLQLLREQAETLAGER